MRENVLYILFDSPSVSIQLHIPDFKHALILVGRQVIFLMLRALKSLQYDREFAE
jgi:hypothetical protein